jgi:hypothetical protein
MWMRWLIWNFAIALLEKFQPLAVECGFGWLEACPVEASLAGWGVFSFP